MQLAETTYLVIDMTGNIMFAIRYLGSVVLWVAAIWGVVTLATRLIPMFWPKRSDKN